MIFEGAYLTLGGGAVVHVRRCKLEVNVSLADEFLEGAGVQTLKFRFKAGLNEAGKDGAIGLDDFRSRARFSAVRRGYRYNRNRIKKKYICSRDLM